MKTAEDDLQAAEAIHAAREQISREVGKVVVGQKDVLDEILIALFARGHCLLVGVPGLAKTLMIQSLAQAMSLRFSRIQFTPDLMPADITGTEVIQTNQANGERELRFLKGPIFANIVLADEINRTPPKTQAALLEAMQEHQVTSGGMRHPLLEPFFVLATQNPIEQEGTYPLPEAQLDRFMFNIHLDYPSEDEECEIVSSTTVDEIPQVEPTITGEELLALSHTVRRVPAAGHVVRYAVRLARASRPDRNPESGFVRDHVTWGAGPRASQVLILGAKARAVLQGRWCAECDDVRAVALPALRHRIVTNFHAEAEGITADDVVRRLLQDVPEHPSD